MAAETLIGIQGEPGAFHHVAADVLYADAPNVRYVHHKSHEALLADVFDPTSDVHKAVIAVDNNTSGRVVSAIDALRDHSNIHVTESITLPIDQYLLIPPGHTLEGLQAVLSQIPALGQCEKHIAAAGLAAEPYYDTAAAASRLRDSNGRYKDYDSVAAIGSELAGETYGLEVGPKFNDNPHNATKFWVVTDTPEPADGTHTALTFEVPDRPAGLCEAVGVLAMDFGLDFTDIDSHLTPHKSEERAFFAEIQHDDISKLEQAVEELQRAGMEPNILGTYTPVSTLEVEKDNNHVPAALRHDEWSGRQGLDYPENATTIYVETQHKPRELYRVLRCLSAINLLDLGRPTIPKDPFFNRGFYIVMDPATQETAKRAALHNLIRNRFKVDIVERQAV